MVTVDPAHFARGPVFRAADLLREEPSGELACSNNKKKGRRSEDVANVADEWLHWGEYLVMYRIPAQAIRDQTPIAKVGDQKQKGVGVIGGGSSSSSGGGAT